MRAFHAVLIVVMVLFVCFCAFVCLAGMVTAGEAITSGGVVAFLTLLELVAPSIQAD
jgi:hypothetical protein